MMQQVNLQIYHYIIEMEILLVRRYKLNPFEFGEYLTVTDMQSYVDIITKKDEEERKKIDNKGMWTGLMGIRDILNFMSYKK